MKREEAIKQVQSDYDVKHEAILEEAEKNFIKCGYGEIECDKIKRDAEHEIELIDLDYDHKMKEIEIKRLELYAKNDKAGKLTKDDKKWLKGMQKAKAEYEANKLKENNHG